MSLKPVDFLTPIRCGDRDISMRHRATAFVDAYFHLRGQVAVIDPTQRRRKGDSQAVSLMPAEEFGLHSILKVASYAAYFLNRFIVAKQFPSLAANQRVAQIQTFLNWLPAAMFVAKVLLRSTQRFHVPQAVDTRPAAPPDSVPFANGHRIDPRIKESLDGLLGRKGMVDELSPLSVDKKVRLEDMTESIMKGVIVERTRVGNETRPFIVIRLQRKDDPLQQRHLLILRQADAGALLWESPQPTNNSSPRFFRYLTLTNAGTGALLQSAYLDIANLQALIRNGSGKDLNGVEWELVRGAMEEPLPVRQAAAAPVPDDLISEQVRRVLNDLLGDFGPVANLLTVQLKNKSNVALDVDEMSHPVMKGVGMSSHGPFPFIAIRMECTGDISAGRKQLSMTPQTQGRVLILMPIAYAQDGVSPLAWQQLQTSDFYPVFFPVANDFTDHAGRLDNNMAEHFARLQKVIKTGEGIDLNNRKWKIIGHPKLSSHEGFEQFKKNLSDLEQGQGKPAPPAQPNPSFVPFVDNYRIDPLTKGMLNTLLQGRSLSVDDLPGLLLGENTFPTADMMLQPIVKGLAGPRPFIAIKMRCTSDSQKVVEAFPNVQWGFPSRATPGVLRSDGVLLFAPLMDQDDVTPTLAWKQILRTKVYPVYPTFFSDESYVTHRNGTLLQSENFANLQKVIQMGTGTDLKGITWEITGHPNSRSAPEEAGPSSEVLKMLPLSSSPAPTTVSSFNRNAPINSQDQKILNDVLGRLGPVEQLPTLELDDNGPVTIDGVRKAIGLRVESAMVCVVQDQPFIVIQMRYANVDTQPNVAHASSAVEDCPLVLIHTESGWNQLRGSKGVYPVFFKGAGKEIQQTGFVLLQKFIQKGGGSDACGINWALAGSSGQSA